VNSALERLTAEELADFLHPDPEEGSEELAELDDLILLEVRERLGDPERRSDIPGTTLLQLARDVIRVREAESARKAATADTVEPPALAEIIATAGLPKARKRELVRGEILRLTGEIEHLNGMLDELED
jgi:hypothetical protein